MIGTAFACFALAALLGSTFVALSIAVLHRLQIMDVANDRSSHTGSVPRGAGAGVALAVVVASLTGALVGDAPTGALGAVLGLAVILGLMGLVDDVRGLPVLPRLAAQLAVSLLFVVVLVRSVEMSGIQLVGFVAIATVFLAGFVNAFNFMDGINGISGLTAGVGGAWFVWLGSMLGEIGITLVGAALAGAALGFLPFNVPTARIFLGDVGSYFLGALMAATACASLVAGSGLLTALAPLLIYVLDTGSTLILRLARREPWREAHRSHTYQRLVHISGMSHLQSAAVAAIASGIVCTAVALLPQAVAVMACVLVSVCYLSAPRVVRRASSARVR